MKSKTNLLALTPLTNIPTHTGIPTPAAKESPRSHKATKSYFVPSCLRGKNIIALFALLLLATQTFAQSPYLGGADDGYAMQKGKISLVRAAIAPDWAQVYPSPVQRGEPMEVLVLDVLDAVEAQLYDVQGRLLQRAGKVHVLGEQRLSLPTATLAAGCYLLRVVRDEDVFTQKVIVWDE